VYDQLAPTVQRALPWLSLKGRVVVEALLLSRGSLGSATSLAPVLRTSTRFGVARLLRNEGLPPLHRLSAWLAVVCWVWEWQQDRTSLFRAAVRLGREPAACYRLVKRVTGLPWTMLRATNMPSVLSMFVRDCEGGVVGRKARPYSKDGELTSFTSSTSLKGALISPSAEPTAASMAQSKNGRAGGVWTEAVGMREQRIRGRGSLRGV
jgi:hypothetical protein